MAGGGLGSSNEGMGGAVPLTPKKDLNTLSLADLEKSLQRGGAKALGVNEYSAAELTAARDKKRQEDALARYRANATQKAEDVAAGGMTGRLREIQGVTQTAGEKALISGAKFGEAVLGPEGLGRLGTDADIIGVQDRLKSLSQGMDSQEEMARREQGISQINTGAASQSRALQAALARSGVKGAQAGAQQAQVAQSAIEARGQLEQGLMAQKGAMERQGLQDYASSLSNVKTFDLSQAAKEKDIVLQAASGERQLSAADEANAAALRAQAAKKKK